MEGSYIDSKQRHKYRGASAYLHTAARHSQHSAHDPYAVALQMLSLMSGSTEGLMLDALPRRGLS